MKNFRKDLGQEDFDSGSEDENEGLISRVKNSTPAMNLASSSIIEKVWVPNYQQHTYPFRGQRRVQTLIDLPTSFGGKE